MNVSVKVLLYLAEPIIMSVIEEMVKAYITAENLLKIREQFFAKMVEWTGKTSFTIDDALVKSIFDAISNPAPGAIETADTFLDMLENWINASETKWIADAFIPVITAFREATGIADGED